MDWNVSSTIIVPLITAAISWFISFRVNKKSIEKQQDLHDQQTAAQNETHLAELEQQQKLHNDQIERFTAADRLARQALFLENVCSALVEIAERAKSKQLVGSDAMKMKKLSLNTFFNFTVADRSFSQILQNILERLASQAHTLSDPTTREKINEDGINWLENQLSNSTLAIAKHLSLRVDPEMQEGCDSQLSKFNLHLSFEPKDGESVLQTDVNGLPTHAGFYWSERSYSSSVTDAAF